MKEAKRKRLEAAGWSLGSAEDFLDLSPEQAAFVELKLTFSASLKERRIRQRLSQSALAKRLKSSQSRVAKMEAGDPTVSLDLLLPEQLAQARAWLPSNYKRDLRKYLGRIPKSEILPSWNRLIPQSHLCHPRSPGRFKLFYREKCMADTKITVNNNGSLKVEGSFGIYDQEGNAFDLTGRTVISFCRCGHSQNKPFCDGSHKKVGFNSEIKARALPPPVPKP